MSSRPAVVLPLLILVGSLILGAGVVAQPAAPAGTPAGSPIATPGATPIAATPPFPLDGERRDSFARFVIDSVAELGVPGAEVVVVQNGQVVFLEGYGVREIGGTAPVTPDTLMEVGSITKPFTSLLAATLVDDSLVTWETPVTDLFPGFTLADAALAERLTLESLVPACSGLPGRDEAIFWNADELDPRGVVASLAGLAPTAPVGERFQYSNQVYTVGGYALAVAAGAAPGDLLAGYQRAIRDRVLNPIGMPRSTFDLDSVLSSGDYAVPHGIDLNGTTRPLPLLQLQRPLAPLDPAAGLWSNATELGRWLQTLLAGGVTPDGIRVVSAANLARVWQQHVTISSPYVLPGTEGYGLGWFTGNLNGQRLLSHSGSTPGFLAEMALLPEANLGLAVLTNGGTGGALAFAVQQRLFELLLGVPEAAAIDIDRAAALVPATLAALRAQIGTTDPATVAPFVGRYANPTLGEVELSLQDGRLIFDAGEVRSELRPLRTRPDPDPRYVFVDPGAVGSAPVVLRMDAAGRPEILLASPALPSVEALTGEPAPPYVFTAIDALATPTALSPDRLTIPKTAPMGQA